MTASFAKKQRERSRQERQREKAQKRQVRKAEAEAAANTRPNEPGVDPDIAHIVPGPQPRLEDDEP